MPGGEVSGSLEKCVYDSAASQVPIRTAGTAPPWLSAGTLVVEPAAPDW